MKRFLWLLAIALNVASLFALASRTEFRKTSTLRIACAVGIDSACVSLGWNYSRGWQVPQDLPRALAIFEKSCAGGSGEACRSAGDFYNGWPAGMSTFGESDERTKAFREGIRNRSRAIHYYDAGCDEGEAQACDSLGTLYHDANDDAKAMAAWKRACQLESFFGCRHIERLAREGNAIAAATVVPRSRNPFAEWKRGLVVWILALLLSIAVGIFAAVTRASAPAISRRAMVIIAALTALAMTTLAIYLRVNADGRTDRTTAYAIAVPAILLAIGALLLAVKGDGVAAWTFLLIGGFLSIPTGLFAILVVRESRATRAASEAEPAPA